MDHDFIIPKVGMGITEVEILKWKVEPGDRVSTGDSIVEIDVEKANTVLEADNAGIVKELLVLEGDIVEVGSVICRIGEE